MREIERVEKFFHSWHHRLRRERITVILHINEFAVVLTPNKRIKLMDTVNVGHKDTLTIEFLDQRGNPMLVTPTADAPPTWTNIPSPAVDTLSVAQDGSQCVVTATAVGSDTVTLDVKVGGKDYSAELVIDITPEPQVLTSVAIASSIE